MHLSRYRFLPSRVAYLIMGMNIAVYIMELLIGQELFFYHLGLVPALLRVEGSVHTLLTSIYLHADPLHIFSNMFALWIFGPECEIQIGGRNFFLLYHVAGLVGNVAHVMSYPWSLTPIVGASGAIFGIVAAFAVLFPLRPILVFWFFPMVLPAALYAGLYFAFEVVYEFSGLNPFVAHMAHIGGFAVGVLFSLIYKKTSRPWRRKKVKIVWVEN